MSEAKVTHVRLPIEAVPDLRKALAYALHSTVEVIRVRSLAHHEESMGRAWHENGTPIIPAQNEAESLAPIADALLWLEFMEELPRGGE